MITYEQDPDVVRWGLELFDGDPFSYCGYGGTVTQDCVDYCHGQYFMEDHYGTECSNVDNDELVAHALQVELSQLTVAEGPESALEGTEHLQVPIFPQNCFGQSLGTYCCGNASCPVEADGTGPSCSCSTPGEESYCGEEWSYSLELTDEYDLDGIVGKRLNQMIPIPHIPKINGEIPSVDEATLDHQRLLDRLQLYELVELKVQGDGNCQFRALSDQFYRTPEHHKFVRQQVVNQLTSHPEIYEGYVTMVYGEYLKKLTKCGEWGDHVTLQAAADLVPLMYYGQSCIISRTVGPSWTTHCILPKDSRCLAQPLPPPLYSTFQYGVKIFVITSFKDTCYIEILPKDQKSERVIFLSFWAEVHYNSIYPEGGRLA